MSFHFLHDFHIISVDCTAEYILNIMGGPGAMKSRSHKVIYLWIIPSGSTMSYVYHTLSIQKFVLCTWPPCLLLFIILVLQIESRGC